MMESTTAGGLQGKGLADGACRLEAASWAELTGVLPSDLDASAKASGALVRRRGIQSAPQLEFVHPAPRCRKCRARMPMAQSDAK